MLGKQFENTYWTNGEGDTTAYLRTKTGLGRRVEMQHVDAYNTTSPYYQGMLFHPDTATGRGVDPLIDQQARTEIATKALGLDVPMSEYKNRVLDVSPPSDREYDKFNSERAESHIGKLVDNLRRSRMTTDEIAKINTTVAVVQREGRAYADSRKNVVKMNHASDRYPKHVDMGPGAGTLLHELGHIQDKGVLDAPDRVDPRAEGIADGTESLHNPNGFFTDAKWSDIMETGYGHKYSSFKGKTGKALYVAARAHIMSGGSSDDIPGYGSVLKGAATKDGLVWKPGAGLDDTKHHTRLQEVTLGHILDRSEASRTAVDQLGYGRQAKSATKAFEAHYPPVPHAVELKTGDDANLSRQQFRKDRHGRAVDNWEAARDRPNIQTETLF